MSRQTELDKLACERDGRLMADGCSECEENLEDAYLRLTTLVESCSARNAKDVDEIERLTTEGERQKQFISLVQWIIKNGYDDPESMIRRIRFELALLTDNVDSASGRRDTQFGDEDT